MVDDLLCGRVTSFRREQGFGVITLDDGRDVPFDASNCTMIPEEGAAVRLRVGPAKWGGGEKALHVEPRGSTCSAFSPPPHFAGPTRSRTAAPSSGIIVQLDASNGTSRPSSSVITPKPCSRRNEVTRPHRRSSTIDWQYYRRAQIGHAEPTRRSDSVH